MERLYHLLSVNEKSGDNVVMTLFPVTHAECCTMKSKLTNHPHRRLELVEAPSYSSAADFSLLYADLVAMKASRDVLAKALRELACFDDREANARLGKTGSYSLFDDPDAVKTAREALAAAGLV